jgi:S-adenosylmethionine synthetase
VKPVLPKELVKGQPSSTTSTPPAASWWRTAGRLRPHRPQDHRRQLRRRGPAGGGAFSGKDPSKVDVRRPMPRANVAKNVVRPALPIAARSRSPMPRRGEAHQRHGHDFRNRQGVGREARGAGRQHFDLRPKASCRCSTCCARSIEDRRLRPFRPQRAEFTWEKTDKAAALARDAGVVRKTHNRSKACLRGALQRHRTRGSEDRRSIPTALSKCT